jgi:hypothetical protein
LESPQVFERNLARLRARCPRLAERVAAADASAVTAARGPTGAVTLAERGVQLGSAYDPVAEGRRQAAPFVAAAPDLLVAVGVGLAHHVEAWRSACRAPVLVYEPSPARLRALLAARADLDWIAAPEVHWAADLDELTGSFQSLYQAGLAVRSCVHPIVARLDAGAVREALDRVAHAKRALDAAAATRVTMMRTWSEIAVDNAPQIVATPGLSALHGRFEGVPAVVVAAGPSLDVQLARLAAASPRVLIVAIGQAVAALLRAGIQPHLVHAIESKNVAHQLTETGDSRLLSLVLAPSTHPALFEVPVRARFVATPASYGTSRWIAEALGETHFVPGGATVTHSAVHLAVALGARDVALIGQDLAFTGGRVYATGSAYAMVSFEELGDGRYAFTNLGEKKRRLGAEAPAERRTDALVHVAGWHGGTVPTSRAYASFLENYRGIGEHLAARGVRLVNCTEGGARIPGLAHETFDGWLARRPTTEVDARRRIESAYDAAPRHRSDVLCASVVTARAQLAELERAARDGCRRGQRAKASRGGLRAAARRVDVLQSVARGAAAVLDAIEPLAWLDDLVPAELHHASLAARRNGAGAGAGTELDAALALFDAALRAVESGRALLDRLEARLAAPVPRAASA